MSVDYNSTGWKIFKSLFKCVVKAKHLISLQEIEQFGVITTTIDDYDSALAEAEQLVMLPISDIAELMANGVDVILVNRDDAFKIYNLIQDHFKWWSIKLRNLVIFNQDKLLRVKSDLEKMDKVNETCWMVIRSVKYRDDIAKMQPARPVTSFRKKRKKSYGLTDWSLSDNPQPTLTKPEEVDPLDGIYRGLEDWIPIDVFTRLVRM